MNTPPRTVAIVTGSRAEFGLLRPVIDAVRRQARLKLRLVVAGAHFLPPAHTAREVESAYAIAGRVRMQQRGHASRFDDAAAVARGVSGFTRAFRKIKPDWVVVLGDRIEAFAAASAASIAGIALCHIHGGDRAEGIADEAMRHAITKLAHLHCAATTLAAERIIRMGERPEHVHVTGSPAIDALRSVRPMPARAFARLGAPRAVVLMHPAGLAPADEQEHALAAIVAARSFAELVEPGAPPRLLLLAPNADAGRRHVLAALDYARQKRGWPLLDHLPRPEFLALLARLARDRSVLVGNSSAGLIEAAALGVRVINVGPRQAGRERAPTVTELPSPSTRDIALAVARAAVLKEPSRAARDAHPFGDGRAGPRIASLLARTDPRDPALLRKRLAY
ncbi:MAG: UDP-N-acetylglucosamine 2-epimerase [Phycisphaerales bacterium]